MNGNGTLVLIDFDDTLINTSTRDRNTKEDWILLDTSIQQLLQFIKSLHDCIEIVILTSSRVTWVSQVINRYRLHKTREELKTIRVVHVETYLETREEILDIYNHKYYVVNKLFRDRYSHYISIGDGLQELECSKKMQSSSDNIIYKHIEFKKTPELKILVYQHIWVVKKLEKIFYHNNSINLMITIYSDDITKTLHINGLCIRY